MPTVREYETTAGLSPFGQWFRGLNAQASRRVQIAVRRMELGNPGDVKSVGEGVCERRIDFGPGYRIYFANDGGKLIILLGGGSKKRQQWDIEDAKAHWADYKQRKTKES